jgi:hypothetical protein
MQDLRVVGIPTSSLRRRDDEHGQDQPHWLVLCMMVRIITPVMALPKIAPIIQAKQISRVLLAIAWALCLKIKSVIHRIGANIFFTSLSFSGLSRGPLVFPQSSELPRCDRGCMLGSVEAKV